MIGEPYPDSFPYGEILANLGNSTEFRVRYSTDYKTSPPLPGWLRDRIRLLVETLRDRGYPEPDFFDWEKEGLAIAWAEGGGEVRTLDVALDGAVTWLHQREHGWEEGEAKPDCPDLGGFANWERGA